jgi:hypothetical protein
MHGTEKGIDTAGADPLFHRFFFSKRTSFFPIAESPISR